MPAEWAGCAGHVVVWVRVMGGCVFVTGGSSGIGLALAVKMAARGASVALFARDPAGLALAKDRIAGQVPGARVWGFEVDVSDAVAVAQVFRRAIALCGPPDRVMLSAGTLAMGEAGAMDLALHRRVMDVNYFGSLAVLQAVLPFMGRGSSVGLVGSAAGLMGIYGYSAYIASKFALRGLAEVLRVELAVRGIGVTLCLPPDTDTPMLRREVPDRHPVAALIAAGTRVMSPDEVAESMIRGMDRGRFLVLPGIGVRLLYLFGPVVMPLLRVRQARLLRRMEQGTTASGDVRG